MPKKTQAERRERQRQKEQKEKYVSVGAPLVCSCFSNENQIQFTNPRNLERLRGHGIDVAC